MGFYGRRRRLERATTLMRAGEAKEDGEVTMAFSSLSIANEFLRRGWKGGRQLTPIQLIKLVYIAHGWFLALTGKPLIKEKVYAWKYGPVVASVYDEFKGFGGGEVTSMAIRPDLLLAFDVALPYSIVDERSEEYDLDYVSQVLDRVWDQYRRFDGLDLSAMTHQPGTPWAQVTKNGYDVGENKVIPNEVIQRYYRKLKSQA
jgi:uncharacterized phage-associated protein